jgi:hypothetical protein
VKVFETIKRFASTDGIASLVAYVVCPQASAAIGAALRVYGGVVKRALNSFSAPGTGYKSGKG